MRGVCGCRETQRRWTCVVCGYELELVVKLQRDANREIGQARFLALSCPYNDHREMTV